MSMYIACEELDFDWSEKDVSEFEHMWREGLDIRDIAKSFGRKVDEVTILILDRARLGYISERQGGVYGRRMPDEQSKQRDGIRGVD